jgi:uncharacterized protein YlbG (UPF0298 family)
MYIIIDLKHFSKLTSDSYGHLKYKSAELRYLYLY